MLCLPSQFPLDPAGVDGIAAVMPSTVLDEGLESAAGPNRALKVLVHQIAEGVHLGPHVVLEDVVAEDHADRRVSREVLRKAQGLGDATRLVLHLLSEAAAEVLAGPHLGHHVPHVLRARHDQDLRDPRLLELPPRMPDHGGLAYRQQMLVRHLRQGKKAGTGTTGQNNPLHVHAST